MPILTPQDMFDRSQVGKMLDIATVGLATGTMTAAAAASGGISMQMMPNSLGTTLWSAIQDYPYQAGITDNVRVLEISGANSRAVTHILGRVYKIGTLNLTTVLNEFTHDSPTFPLLRTRYGQASQPISLIPFIQITTALSVVASVFTMNYVDQDGNSVTGASVFTMPSATAAIGSCYILPLEQDDLGVRDISDIVISTPSTTGAATIYGFEPLIGGANIGSTSVPVIRNGVYRGFNLANIQPAVPTSGSVTSLLMMMGLGSAASSNFTGAIKAYRDN